MDQQRKIFNIAGLQVPHFSYEELGVKGVGVNRHPILPMDEYIDHSRDTELHIECCKGLALCNDYKMGMIYGALPPEEVVRLNGSDGWTETLKNIEKLDPTGVHLDAVKDIIKHSPKDQVLQNTYKYCYFALGSAVPWFFALYIKNNDFSKKTKDVGQWTDSAKHFPKLVEYLETLPFKEIGRVLLFTTYPTAGVVTHRDSIVAEHKDHNINLFFDGGWRPSFIWDEIKKEKIYLPQGSKSYFFNNRDYHGVDPEPVFRYTVRIDGTFTDELCEQLGLEAGYTWKWNYENQQSISNKD